MWVLWQGDALTLMWVLWRGDALTLMWVLWRRCTDPHVQQVPVLSVTMVLRGTWPFVQLLKLYTLLMYSSSICSAAAQLLHIASEYACVVNGTRMVFLHRVQRWPPSWLR